MNWLCSKWAMGCELCVSTAIKYLEKLEVLWVISEGLYLTLMVFRIQMPQKIPQTVQIFISVKAQNHTIRRIVTLNLPVNQRVRSDRFSVVPLSQENAAVPFTVTNKWVVQSRKHLPLVGRRPFVCVCSLSGFSVENTP